MSEVTHSYIGRLPCGCVVAAFVDDPRHKKAIAKEIGSWVKDGMTVERVEHEYVRQHLTFRCLHGKKQSSPPQPMLPGLD